MSKTQKDHAIVTIIFLTVEEKVKSVAFGSSAQME
jgi:hypothetical protein